MKAINFLTVSLLLFSSSLHAQSPLAAFYEKVDAFMKQNITDSGVRYKSVNKKELKELTTHIANMNLESASATEKKAFYINAYNVLVIEGIINSGFPKSPLDVEGFFDKIQYKVAGEPLGLNDIENKKIRETYHDARIHFVLVCAANGCPKIVPFAYFPEKLDAQLTQQAQAALNDAEWLKVDTSNQKILLSEIFKWYKGDFVAEAPSLIEYVNKYRKEAVPTSYSVDHYTYDWALNIRD